MDICNILVVEDDPDINKLLCRILEGAGYAVTLAADCAQARRAWTESQPDAALLDVMLPKIDGFGVCELIRRQSQVPILMLTARSELEDRIEGLNAGADYYLTKPFDIRELLACINALLRRQGPQVDQVTLGNTALDLGACTLICGEKRVQLSAREFDVMRILLRSQSTILSKEVILARVWGYDSDAVENHVEVYVGFLRKKLHSIGSNIRIEAVRRLGYRLEVDEEC